MDIMKKYTNLVSLKKIFSKNGTGRICFAFLFLFIIPLGTLSSEEEPVDPIYEKCISQKENPGPWCYLEEVKKKGDPDLCKNIIKYWPKAKGVCGQCYYELARKKMDCELCKRIKDKDIKKMCELDVCE